MIKVNKTILKSSGFFITVIFASSCMLSDSDNKNSRKHEVEQLPNVLLIYTDDLGYGDVSCYNHDSKISTPHIDKLADKGMMFTDAHSAASFCTPSRYSLLTGNYCWRSKATSMLYGGFDRPMIKKHEMTLGNLFQTCGYKTAAIGKWHLGMIWKLKDGKMAQNWQEVDYVSPLVYTPIDQGFDYYFGTSGCTSDDLPFAFIENRKIIGLPMGKKKVKMLAGPGEIEEMEVPLASKDWAHERADTIFTNKAIAFIEDQVANKKPFFVYLPLSLPHIPWLPAEFVKGTTGAGPRGDLVALADYCVGKLVATLKKLNIEENTIIVFTSDNGPRQGENGHQSSGHLRAYKRSIYEGGHRIPFIVKWPDKIKSNSRSDELIGQIDLFATFAKILKYPLPDTIASDSYDISPVLLGQDYQKPIRETLIQLGMAVRHGDWKMIFSFEQNSSGELTSIHATELYNLNEDLSEQNNMIDNHPEKVEELKSIFAKSVEHGSLEKRYENQNN